MRSRWDGRYQPGGLYDPAPRIFGSGLTWRVPYPYSTSGGLSSGGLLGIRVPAIYSIAA